MTEEQTSSGQPEQPHPPVDSAHELTSTARLSRERLLDLAYDVSSYLRRHAQPAVRISAALLLAASLAACNGDQQSDGDLADAVPTVAPLTQEVREGLPQTPGRYTVVRDSMRRDEQGVYHFAWYDPGVTSGEGHDASASLLKLAEGPEDLLDVPPIGDPTLFLRHNSQVALSSVDQRQYTGGSYGYVPSFVYWRPFFVGTGYSPGYYYPPVRSIPPSGTVDGSSVSSTPRAPAERTIGLRTAVAGRAGGTGGGSAATGKSGAGVSSSGGGKSSVTSPGSSSFSGGGAATGKSSGGGSSSGGSSS